MDSRPARVQNPRMAPWTDEAVGRRVFLEDSRRNGQFARITWHADARQFVLSNWEGNLCVGATRVGVEEATAMVHVLTEGIADAASRPVEPPSMPPSPLTLREHVAAWWRARGRRAAVLPFRTERAQRRRSA